MSFEQPFLGQTALVTGAGTGIGFEVARRLAMSGAGVAINDVDGELAERAAQVLRQQGGDSVGLGGDVSSAEVARSLVKETESQLGPVSLLVANAGITEWSPFLESTEEQFERVVGVNLRGTFFLVQAVARRLVELSRPGSVVLTSSMAGRVSVENLGLYGMTKTALSGLARSLVVEMAPRGVRINAVAPGATVTDRNLRDQPAYDELWGEVTPRGRTAQPGDIAEAVLMLLSPSARHVVGQTLVVDGGWGATAPTPPSHAATEEGD